MTVRAWPAYAAVVVTAVVAYLAVPAGQAWEDGFQVGIQATLTAGLLAGARRVPAGDRAPWLFFALGLLCTTLATLPLVGGGRAAGSVCAL